MNCFNIRELQGILKRRFFADLVNSADHRDVLSTSMIGLRFKNNNNLNLDHDTLAFFKFGTNNSNKLRSSNYQNYYTEFLNTATLPYNSGASTFSISSLNFYFIHFSLNSSVGILNIFHWSPIASLLSLFNFSLFNNFFSLIRLNLGFNFMNLKLNANSISSDSNSVTNNISYSSDNIYANMDTKYSFLEQESLSRFSRFSNPVISYDYKCGNYIGI
jgi:hypothetical protein